MKTCRFLLPALMAGLIFAMTSHAAPLDSFKGLSGTLDIAGGTAHIPVMKGAAKNIMTANPDIRITVAGGGSGVGVQQVGEGLVQIGNTGRALKEKEIAKYGLQSFPFAIDGVALVVNPANKVRAITAQQAQDIFAGKITNWKALGGADAPITVYTREDGSGTREVFVEKALKKGPIVASANVVNSNGAMKTAIGQDKLGIGYVGIGHVDKSVAALTFDKMVPSQENAASGAYTLTRLLYGARVSLITGLLSSIWAALVGTTLGLISGYFGGWIDTVIMRLTDAMIAIPPLIFTMVLSSIVSGNLLGISVVIGVSIMPSYIRMVNGLVVSLRENDYVVAANLIGQKQSIIMFKHLLPNCFASLIVIFTMNLGTAVMLEATLSYLGVGIVPPTPAWGVMVSEGYKYLFNQPLIAILPGICIMLVVIAFNIVGDALRDALDPRLRGKL